MWYSKLIAALLFTCLIYSCSNQKYPKAENALDAAREFISASLKGDFDRASFYMLKDSANEELLVKQKRNYNDKSDDQKIEYHNASIIIFDNATLNDSTTIINYQNSYDKISRKVKVVKTNNSWFVDFKYTFNGNL